MRNRYSRIIYDRTSRGTRHSRNSIGRYANDRGDMRGTYRVSIDNDRNDYIGHRNDYSMDRHNYPMYGENERYSPYNEYLTYDYKDSDEDYHKDLKVWKEKLKRKDRFGISEKDLLERAKQMGVRFKDYDEDEFLAVYYMLMSDFEEIANAPETYLAMAQKWLEDDDIEVSPSEKLCIYMYDIVKGESE